MAFFFNPFLGNLDYYQSASATPVGVLSQSFTTTGLGQVVLLSASPVSILMVTLNGQPQNPADYSLSGSSLTVNVDVPAGLWATVVYSSATSTASTTLDTFTTTGGVQVVTLTNTPTTILSVIVDGQVQNPADYSNVGAALTINIPTMPAGVWGTIMYAV